jgi:nucleoside-diphosphate-sugar epimerase
VFKPLPQDDPTRRKPDIGKARALLAWEPQVALADGLKKSLPYFQNKLDKP